MIAICFFAEEYARLKRLGNDVQYEGDGNLIQEQDCMNYAVQRNEGRSQRQELMSVLVEGDVFRGLCRPLISQHLSNS